MIDRSQPFCHRKVRITEDPTNTLQKFYGKPVNWPMLTDFEHDRRQLILRFPYSDRQSNFKSYHCKIFGKFQGAKMALLM
jgi:hypothetical protein